MHYSISAVTDVGMVRQTNEDMFLIAGDEIILGEGEHFEARIEGEGDFLAVVVDGMGGAEAGVFAARCAVDSILNFFKKSNPNQPLSDVVLEALQFANQEIFDQVQPNPQLGGSCAAVCLVVKRGNEHCLAKYGNVDLFLVRGKSISKTFREFTLPDTILWCGGIPEGWPIWPESCSHFHVLGGYEVIHPSIALFTFRPGDFLFILSDGVWEKLNDGENWTELAGMANVDGLRKLVQCGNERGGEDNLTAMVIGFDNSETGEFSEIPISSDLKTVRIQFTQDSPMGIYWTDAVKCCIRHGHFEPAKRIADSVPEEAHRGYLLGLLKEAGFPR